MGLRPSIAHTLDRKDNAGNYDPNNCRWATKQEQSLNSRHVRLVSAFGKTQALSEWAKETKVPYMTILARLNRGYDPERALMEPSKNTYVRRAFSEAQK